MCLCHLADPSSQMRHSFLPSLPQRPPSPPRPPVVLWPENLTLLLKTSPAKECFLGVRTGAPPAASMDLSLTPQQGWCGATLSWERAGPPCTWTAEACTAPLTDLRHVLTFRNQEVS